MDAAEDMPARLCVRYVPEGGLAGVATLLLLWDEAPKTCAAVVQMLKDGALSVKAVHGRHSGGEVSL